MLNQVVLVGRTVRIMPDKEKVKLAIQRTHKNDEGIYETDFFNVKLPGHVVTSLEYIKIGDMIGIKGRLEGGDRGKVEVIAEKVTFLSTGKN